MTLKTKRVFVTVGTTKFEKLINAVSEEKILNKLHMLGFKEVQFQTGSGRVEKKSHPLVQLHYTSYFENFISEIDKSDLIISHAGAGTCLEVLYRHKPLIVIINEDLMDNHQLELAEQLQNDGYLYFCKSDNLLEVLQKDFSCLKPYPKADENVFSTYLDTCMGFKNT